jgi:hypothetical protein
MATSPLYFTNFPAVNYAGFAATNIMARVVIDRLFQQNYNLFYDYKVPQGKRADQIAFDLYGKSEYVWVIYLLNNIKDPYYDWVLSDENFTSFIEDKYGSIANAELYTCFYRNNWPSDDSTISTAAWQALPDALKKYWKPQLLPGNRILSYYRNPVDTVVSTNQIAQAQIAYTSNTTFQIGEYVTQGNASGFISPFVASTSTLVTYDAASIQHITGVFQVNTTPVIGSLSGASALLIEDSLFVQNVIPSDEMVYFSPVSNYDIENEKNEQNSLIKLLRVEYLPMIVNAFSSALSS